MKTSNEEEVIQRRSRFQFGLCLECGKRMQDAGRNEQQMAKYVCSEGCDYERYYHTKESLNLPDEVTQKHGTNYPDEEELKIVKEWDSNDFEGWMKYIHHLWAYEDYVHEDNGIWYVSTGGWSGNESIIEAMRKNRLLWMLHWYSSRRGGHYEFRTRDALNRD